MTALHQRGGFTSAQELHEGLEANGISIGLTMVYRTLHALDRSGQLDVVREKSGSGCTGPCPPAGTATVPSAVAAASARRSSTRWN
ncbi:transcriptional repressor [Streptomyces pseudogriseolus]|uniref:transcriptional repressor n=1 Tax=Streptomyces pseudogriseolus TaxID=36817 RepID=UPI003FA1D938